MRPIAVLSLLLLPTTARADWPTDVVLSGMDVHHGIRTTDSLREEYRSLVRDIGTAISNQPIHPAQTLGAWGFELSANTTFVFIDAYAEGDPSPWQRATESGDPDVYLFVPSLTARKGLPWSVELGMSGGWIGGSHQGAFGGYGRVAILEGYKPYPDVCFQIGYAGYVGNPELDVGALDLHVEIGSPFKLYRMAGITFSVFSPYLDFSMLRVTAAPRVDEATMARLDLVRYGGVDADEKGMWIPRIATGFQVTNNKVLGRLAVAWAPATVPTFTFGLGFAL